MTDSNQNAGPTTQIDNNWKTVKSKKNMLTKEKLDEKMTTMKKTKITIMIRVPNDAAADYSAAEVHIATIRELGKQDANLIVLDHKGTNQVNIHKSFGHDKYKEHFQPREKPFRGSVQVSVAHHLLTETSSFNKAILMPFLKKNKVYVFFNQKDGLEHFAAIGVLFGPHPELAWRQTIIERLEKTMKADITEEDCQKLKSTIQDPKIVVSIVPQQISNPKYNQTKSFALELRVPAEHESTYLEIMDRLNERACTLKEDEIDIILDDSIGTFFPYYAKRNKPELFDTLMRKQNYGLSTTSAIPLFGYTQQAKEYLLEQNGVSKTVREIIWKNPNIIAIEPTASSLTLGKYMVLADRDFKEDVEDFIDAVFAQMPELEDQPENFKKPQRGGNAFKKNRIHNISNYLKKLEDAVSIDQLMTDEDSEYSSSPPTRPRRPTISYAQATKRLSFQNETVMQTPKNATIATKTTNTTTTNMSTLTHDSLNEAINSIRQETENSIKALREELKSDVKSMEHSIASTVIEALQKAKQNPMNMEVEQNEMEESMETETHDTTTTMKTMMDRFDSMTQMIQVLAVKVTEIAEAQENNSKRSRPTENTARQPLTPPEKEKEAKSPPAKQARQTNKTPPSTPPPYGRPNATGAREGS